MHSTFQPSTSWAESAGASGLNTLTFTRLNLNGTFRDLALLRGGDSAREAGKCDATSQVRSLFGPGGFPPSS